MLASFVAVKREAKICEPPGPEVSILSRTFPIVALLCPFALAAGASAQSHHSSSRTHSSKSTASKKKESTKDKRVHVRGYTRKDGTYVAPYDRSAPGTTDSSSTSTNTGTAVHPY